MAGGSLSSVLPTEGSGGVNPALLFRPGELSIDKAFSNMVLKAALVLEDCKEASRLLDEVKSEAEWRVVWVGAMALLRAVGHVLRDEAREDPILEDAVTRAFDRHAADRKANRIFWEFIKVERDLLLKEYDSTVYDRSEVDLVFFVEGAAERTTLDGNIYRPVKSEHWPGEDARDVYALAIDWWAAELAAILAETTL